MVSKAKSTKGSADVIGQNGSEILSEFREVQAMNENCSNNTFSIVLSPNNDVVHNRQ